MQAWRGKLQLLHFYFFLCGTKCSAFGWDFSKYKTFRVWATDLVVLHNGQRHLDHASDTPCWFILWNNQFIYCSPYIFRSSFQWHPLFRLHFFWAFFCSCDLKSTYCVFCYLEVTKLWSLGGSVGLFLDLRYHTLQPDVFWIRMWKFCTKCPISIHTALQCSEFPGF